MINIDNILSAPLLTDPWPHKEITDVFNEQDFKIINQAATHLSYLCEENKTTPVHISEAIELGISKEATDLIIGSADLILKNVKKIVGTWSLNKLTPGGYFVMPKFGITGKNFKYPIHDESLFKVLNLVVYLQPENSQGTRLYKTQNLDSFTKQITWKTNNAALFFPGQQVTWHNWGGQEHSDIPRITLNFFIEKIEGLKDTLYKSWEDEFALNSLLWFYEKMGQDKLHIEI